MSMKFLAIFIVNCLIFVVEEYSCDSMYPLASIAFYFGPQYYTEYFSLDDFGHVIFHPKYSINKTNVLYIHGYRDSVEDESVKTVIAAYLTKNDHNIFALDWRNYSTGVYPSAVSNVVGLGNVLGTRLNTLAEQNSFNLSRFHIVGHSLGAQMAGYIGKTINLLSGGRRQIQRLTGLDPAKPLFYTNFTGAYTYIHRNDAKLVDIIHTNAGVLGSDVSVGKCDFWPNGGGPWQPGCDVKRRPGCDHTRSWLYYAESVQSREQNFHSYQCDDFNAFKRLNCTSGIMDFMGYHATENCTGTFYLQTNNRSPFSRDVFGLQYLPLGDLDRGSED